MPTTTQGGIPGLRYRPGAQTRRPAEWTPELLEKVEWRRRAAAEPFRGLATSEGVRPGLFPLRDTGADVGGARSAALDYLAGLTPPQLAEGRFPMDDVSWRHWSNGARYFLRHGVCLEELDDRGRERALAIVHASLSGPGYRQVLDIMRLNLTIGELRGEEHLLNEWLYWFSVYGDPDSRAWGWQLDGHHAIINFFVLGDQVVMTPHFFGSEPVRATSGKYKGLVILQEEQNTGFQMLQSLSDAQRQRAIIDLSKSGHNNLTEAFKDNVVLDYAGLRANDLAKPARDHLRDLANLYVSNMDDGHARVKMDEIDRHIENTWFAWIGGSQPDSAFYYRIQSPVILIEFDHQQPANLARFASDPDKPTQQHIHCVVRTPNGNDYGKDLLRQHYLAHPHTS
jgi:hypothetical protein